jgi:hypothetical protein
VINFTVLNRAAEILSDVSNRMVLYEQREECGYSLATTIEEFFARVHSISNGRGWVEAPPEHLSNGMFDD